MQLPLWRKLSSLASCISPARKYSSTGSALVKHVSGLRLLNSTAALRPWRLGCVQVPLGARR